MKTAIFLGAGAAAAEGAPTQAALFRRYFENLNTPASGFMHMDRELVTFFQQMFGIDVDFDDLGSVEFPTFEEALGLLDLAVARGEGLRQFDLVNMAGNSGRLLAVRVYLVLLMAKAIRDGLGGSGHHLHLQMVENLQSSSLLADTVFLTTNYDLLLDNALLEHWRWASGGPSPIDYSVPFANETEWSPPSLDATKLYKVHGSLNWLYCSVCNTIRYTPFAKRIVDLYDYPSSCICPECDSVFEPIVVPPTFFKNMGNVFLARIWHSAEQALRQVDQVIFCGYSFPDADLHLKYLIKRAQGSRPGMKFKVINSYAGKPGHESDVEASRFKRFLGPHVDYTKSSFQDFVANPLSYIA